MSAYYNEWDKKAAAWLRELIARGHIPPGDVDERSITDVDPTELAGYTQLHFFAGIGGWPLAARLAGWPDDREIVTGSCPCQPFSVAGKGAGTADARHLWPDFFRIIRARRPAVVMGEQVAAAVGKDWLLGVRTDLEGIGYDMRPVVVPACAVNAPHRRDRLWFVAGSRLLEDAAGRGDGAALQRGQVDRSQAERPASGPAGSGRGHGGDVAQPDPAERRPDLASRNNLGRQEAGREEVAGHAEQRGQRALSDADGAGSLPSAQRGIHRIEEGAGARDEQPFGHRPAWHGARWLISHDGKARRVEPSIPLLVDGIPHRVGLLRGFGNAIAPQIAAEMMGAWMEEFPL